MISLKNKISSFFKKAKRSLGFFLFFKSSGRVNQIDIDKKLVYSLSPRKIPSGRQLKYLSKFLNPQENLIIRICVVVVVLNLVYLGFFLGKRYIKSVPMTGGTYVEAVVGYPKTINPLYAASRDVDNDLSRLIYSSLFRYNQHGQLENDLVDSYEISEDGKEYILKIKENIKWHNGGDLTSDDIAFTLRLIQDENYRSPLRNELTAVSLEKIDQQTIKLSLPEAHSPLLDLLTFGILPKSIWENISPDAAGLTDLNLKPIGSGPYKFKSLIKNKNGDLKEYILEANENYYQQKPFIKIISFKFFSDHLEAIKSFNNGHLDGLSSLPLMHKDELSVRDSINKFELTRPQIVAIFFNQTNNQLLSEKSTRAALAHAINKEELVAGIYGGAYPLVDGPILPTSFAFNPDVNKYEYSATKAMESLGEKKLALKLTAIDVDSNVAVAERIKHDWLEIGIEVELIIIPLEQAADILKNRKFEALLYGQSIGGDPDVFVFWHSSQIGSAGLNIANYKNEEVDKLLAEARGNASSEERKEKYFKFQEIIAEDLPAIFLYSPTYTYVQAKKVKGFTGEAIIESADRFSGVASWYIKTKKIFFR